MKRGTCGVTSSPAAKWFVAVRRGSPLFDPLDGVVRQRQSRHLLQVELRLFLRQTVKHIDFSKWTTCVARRLGASLGVLV